MAGCNAHRERPGITRARCRSRVRCFVSRILVVTLRGHSISRWTEGGFSRETGKAGSWCS